MSVLILTKNKLGALGKFFTISMSAESALGLIESYHELNVRNSELRYGEDESRFDQIDIHNQPLIAQEQAVKILQSLYYNCFDYGEKIDAETLKDIQNRIKEIRSRPSYNERLEQLTSWYD